MEFEDVRLVSMLLAFAWSASVFANGVGSTGGGASVVCRDSQNKIISAELLDLYEARVRDSRDLLATTYSIEGDYLLATQNTFRLQGSLLALEANQVSATLQRFFVSTEFTLPGVRLRWLGDLGPTVPALNQQGCALEQLAIFDDTTQKISIDSEIWTALNTLNQAALVTHELEYAYERKLEERTSETTRAIVGLIYSAHGVVPVLEGLPAARIHCITTLENRGENQGEDRGEGQSTQKGVSGFYVYPSLAENGHPSGLTLQFTQLMGRPLLTRTTLHLENLSHWDTHPEKGADLTIKAPLDGMQSKGWELEVRYRYDSPVRLTLFQRGKQVQEAVVQSCSPEPEPQGF